MKTILIVMLTAATFFAIGVRVGWGVASAGDAVDRAAASWINQASVLINSSGEERAAVEASKVSTGNFAALTSSVGANFDKLDPHVRSEVQKYAEAIENGVGSSIFEGQEITSSKKLMGVVACMSPTQTADEVAVADCAKAIVTN